MRALRSFLLVNAILASATVSAEGQLSLYAGGSYAEALGGQWGADVRLAYNFIVLPVEAFAGADYFLTDCEDPCGLWGWRIGGDLRFPIPGVTPFLSGAWVYREWELGLESLENRGLAIGGGISIDLGIRIRAEASREFLGEDLDQFVVRVGLGF